MENVITNAKTENAFQGKNLKTLQKAMEKGGFTDPRFVTYNDAIAMGFWVKKGSKAAARIKGERGPYCVFNVEQTSIPACKPVVAAEVPEEDFCPENAYNGVECDYEEGLRASSIDYKGF